MFCSSCAHGNNVCDHNNFCAYHKSKYCMPNWFSIMVNLENDELLSPKKKHKLSIWGSKAS